MIGWRMGSHHLEPSLVIKFSQKIQTLGILHLCVSMLLSLGHTQYSFANPFLFHAIFLSMEGGHNKACAASGVSMENALGRSQPFFFDVYRISDNSMHLQTVCGRYNIHFCKHGWSYTRTLTVVKTSSLCSRTLVDCYQLEEVRCLALEIHMHMHLILPKP